MSGEIGNSEMVLNNQISGYLKLSYWKIVILMYNVDFLYEDRSPQKQQTGSYAYVK